MIELTAQIPRQLIEKKQILYTYYIELTNQNDANAVTKVYEKLFVDNQFVRHLNINEIIGTNNLLKTNNNPNFTSLVAHPQFPQIITTYQIDSVAQSILNTVTQFDGLVLFGDELSYSSHNSFKELKYKQLFNERPIMLLVDFKPDYVYNLQLKFFGNLQRLYDCLCANDAAYKAIFNEVSLNFKCYEMLFKSIVFFQILSNFLFNKLNAVIKKTNHDDSDHLVVIVIFYLTFLFKLKHMQNKEFIQYCLALQNSQNVILYMNFHTIFESERGFVSFLIYF